MCSPDLNRLSARRAVNSLKSTDLSRAELVLMENNYAADFSHPRVMAEKLTYASQQGLNIVFVDDDVEIYQPHWLERLYEVSHRLKADIVSGVQVFDDGSIDCVGEYIDEHGFTDAIGRIKRQTDFIIDNAMGVENVENAAYVPALYSAVMLVRHCGAFQIDTQYTKDKHDLDLCMQAWQKGKRVACALDLKLIHHRGFTGDSQPGKQDSFVKDARLFAQKWKSFIPELYNRPELQPYKQFNFRDQTWTKYYNLASLLKQEEPQTASKMFTRISRYCYNDRLKGGAFFHLFQLQKDKTFLVKCLQVNPCHRGARKTLEENFRIDTQPFRKCPHTNDCRSCHLVHEVEIFKKKR